jgi:hypothetical protein
VDHQRVRQIGGLSTLEDFVDECRGMLEMSGGERVQVRIAAAYYRS